MNRSLRVLIIDDSERDALLLVHSLRKEGIEADWKRVDTATAMMGTIAGGKWDLAICDCQMPEFSVERALDIWLKTGDDQPFIVVSGAIGEEEAVKLLKAGAHDFVRKDNLARLVPAIDRELRETAERNARKEAEEALRQSELHRFQLQAELSCAAEVQRKLLPVVPPDASGFEIAARCLPARHVGGDFYDWLELAPGIVTLTLGDVMGKGMAAAILMATVRATLRAVVQVNPPASALQLAQHALQHDLDRSDSFVTLFHAQLNVTDRKLTYVDCGHGYALLMRADGKAEELNLRGLPLGVSAQEKYQEGTVALEGGDTLVLYSDGLIDAVPELELNNGALVRLLENASSADEAVSRLAAIVPPDRPRPDDMTVLVLRCKEDV